MAAWQGAEMNNLDPHNINRHDSQNCLGSSTFRRTCPRKKAKKKIDVMNQRCGPCHLLLSPKMYATSIQVLDTLGTDVVIYPIAQAIYLFFAAASALSYVDFHMLSHFH
jgi:hypothetical protein